MLNDISFTIQPGETLGIIGGTGSAKSSLVQLIPRLYDAESGTVRVGGVDVRDYNLDVLRREVSMVLQKNVLFSGTILDNLRWGDANATEEECIRMAKLACADEFIQRFPDKYNTWIEQGGSNVSGGQKQRLTIDQDHHCTAHLLGAGCRPHSGAGERPDQRSGHPRRAAGDQRHLSGGLQQPDAGRRRF